MMLNMPTSADLRPALTFRLGENTYALMLDGVVEVGAMMQLLPVVDAPIEVLGMANRHGELLPIIDLRQVMGLPPLPIGLHSLFIVVRHKSQLLGIVVDDVQQVEYLPMKQLQQTGAWGKYIDGMMSTPQLVVQFIALEPLMARYTEAFLKVE